MNLERAIDILEQWSKWCNEDPHKNVPCPFPIVGSGKLITEAIDTVVKHFKQK